MCPLNLHRRHHRRHRPKDHGVEHGVESGRSQRVVGRPRKSCHQSMRPRKSRWATGRDPPVMGMLPPPEYMAWHQRAHGLESDAQVQSATRWAHAAESWTSASEWEPEWESWAPAAEYNPPDGEPEWTSAHEHGWNPEWIEGWQPAADSTPMASSHWTAALPDEAYDVWPDTRTPNHTPDGQRRKRSRGGASERSHNGYYRPKPKN